MIANTIITNYDMIQEKIIAKTIIINHEISYEIAYTIIINHEICYKIIIAHKTVINHDICYNSLHNYRN